MPYITEEVFCDGYAPEEYAYPVEPVGYAPEEYGDADALFVFDVEAHDEIDFWDVYLEIEANYSDYDAF